MTKVEIGRFPGDSKDPLCINIMGTARAGYECIFRGDQKKVLVMLETVMLALQKAPELKVNPQIEEIEKLREQGFQISHPSQSNKNN